MSHPGRQAIGASKKEEVAPSARKTN